MPAEAQHLRAAFRAKVWSVHSEDSDTPAKCYAEFPGSHLPGSQSFRPFRSFPGFQLLPKATQTAVGASENGAFGHQIVSTAANLLKTLRRLLDLARLQKVLLAGILSI